MFSSLNAAMNRNLFVAPNRATLEAANIPLGSHRLPNPSVGPGGRSEFVRAASDLSDTAAREPRVERIPVQGDHFPADNSIASLSGLGKRLDVLA